MYEAYYKLNENPFGMTPNPRFFFRSRSHKDALAYVADGVFRKKGFLALTGEVGLGKTTVVRSFVRTFRPSLEAAFVHNTRGDFSELLYLFLRDFGCEASGSSKVEMLGVLNDFLIESYAENRNPVLFIDEAQNLGVEVLEELRMLSNLESDNSKLIQIVLVGQPELEFLLGRSELRQLRQRIPGIHRMAYLEQSEVGRYIHYRLAVAGLSNGDLVFSEDACEAVYRYTKGVPRLINLLCEKALQRGYANKIRVIDAFTIEASMNEMNGRGQLGMHA